MLNKFLLICIGFLLGFYTLKSCGSTKPNLTPSIIKYKTLRVLVPKVDTITRTKLLTKYKSVPKVIWLPVNDTLIQNDTTCCKQLDTCQQTLVFYYEKSKIDSSIILTADTIIQDVKIENPKRKQRRAMISTFLITFIGSLLVWQFSF